jgi:hypothetical protein
MCTYSLYVCILEFIHFLWKLKTYVKSINTYLLIRQYMYIQSLEKVRVYTERKEVLMHTHRQKLICINTVILSFK